MSASEYLLVDQGPKEWEVASASKQPKPVRNPALRVGIWDLGARIAYLPQLIQAMNKAQRRFRFFQVISAIPAGMISQRERVLQWSRGLKKPEGATTASIGKNLIDQDFFDSAEPIRKNQNLDYLVGLVPATIAFEEQGTAHWNYISSFSNTGTTLLVSVADFREFAARVERPLETLVGWALLSQLLIGRSEQTKSSPDRYTTTIEDVLVAARIEPKKIHPKDRKAAESLVKMLGAYRNTLAD